MCACRPTGMDTWKCWKVKSAGICVITGTCVYNIDTMYQNPLILLSFKRNISIKCGIYHFELYTIGKQVAQKFGFYSYSSSSHLTNGEPYSVRMVMVKFTHLLENFFTFNPRMGEDKRCHFRRTTLWNSWRLVAIYCCGDYLIAIHNIKN